MNAKLRTLFSSDVDDLSAYQPSDEAFCISVRALIGPAGEPGAESFDFDVCSPTWLAQAIARDGIVSGHHRFFMIAFNYDLLERHVLKLVSQASGADWHEVASKLIRWSHWEFEDYVPS